MFLRHSLIYLLARGIPSLIAFSSVAIYTRLLNPGEFGLYALVFTGASLLSSILFQWLRMGLLRFYQERFGEEKIALVSTTAIAFVAVAGGLIVISTPLIAIYKKMVLGALLIAISLAQGAFDILLERARVELSPLRFGIVASLRALGMLMGGIAGFELWGDAQGLLLGLFLGLALVVLLELRRAVSLINLSSASRAEVWHILRFGGPLTATFALAGIMGFADRYMLAGMVNTASAGYYAAAYDITQKSTITLMMVVNLAGYPLLLRAQADGSMANFQTLLRQTLNGLLLIGLPIICAFILLPDIIAGTFLGNAFRTQATLLLPWLSFAALIEGLKVYYFDLSFQLRQNTIHQVWIVGLAALLNVGLNVWLIPLHGGLGAAWATLSSNAVALLLSFAISRTQIKLPLINGDTATILAATVVMGGVLYMAKPFVAAVFNYSLFKLFLFAGLGGFIYTATILGMNVMGVRQQIRARWAARQSTANGRTS